VRLGLRTLDTASGWLCSAGALLSTLGVLWLIGSTAAHVLMRTLKLGGIAGIVELNALVMVVVVFFGLGEAQRRGAHVSVTLGVDRLPATIARYCMFLAVGVSLAVTMWWFTATLSSFSTSFSSKERLTGVTDILVWPARLAIVVGLGILLVETINVLTQAMRQRRLLADDTESLGT